MKQTQSFEKIWSLILTGVNLFIHRVSNDYGFLVNFFGWPNQICYFNVQIRVV